MPDEVRGWRGAVDDAERVGKAWKYLVGVIGTLGVSIWYWELVALFWAAPRPIKFILVVDLVLMLAGVFYVARWLYRYYIDPGHPKATPAPAVFAPSDHAIPVPASRQVIPPLTLKMAAPSTPSAEPELPRDEVGFEWDDEIAADGSHHLCMHNHTSSILNDCGVEVVGMKRLLAKHPKYGDDPQLHDTKGNFRQRFRLHGPRSIYAERVGRFQFLGSIPVLSGVAGSTQYQLPPLEPGVYRADVEIKAGGRRRTHEVFFEVGSNGVAPKAIADPLSTTEGRPFLTGPNAWMAN